MQRARSLYGWGQSIGLFLKEGHMDRVFLKPERLERLKDYSLPFGDIEQIAAGWGHSLVLTTAGEVHSAGMNMSGQLGLGRQEGRGYGRIRIENVSGLACGREHSHLRTDKGKLYSFGNSMYGQLGIGKNRRSQPGQLVYASLPELVDLEGVREVTCGMDHTMLLTEQGLYGMGWSADGQLGQGEEEQDRPSRVGWEERIKKVTSSTDFSLALTKDGEVWVWGNSEYGQGGQGQKMDRIVEPTKIEWARGIQDMAAGGPFSVFLSSEGQVYTCGYGGLGCGEVIESLKPRRVEGLNRVKRVFATTDYAAALTETGELFAWGLNSLSGRLGLGHTDPSFHPKRVSIDREVTEVALGVNHAFALCEE